MIVTCRSVTLALLKVATADAWKSEYRPGLGKSRAEYRPGLGQSRAEYRPGLGQSRAEYRPGLGQSRAQLRVLSQNSSLSQNRM